MHLIQGIHHVALKPQKEQFQKVMEFYTEILGLEVVRRWGDAQYPCTMISTGDNSCIEVLPVLEGEALPAEGKFAHLALATDDVDACIERIRAAGYPVTIEPKDVTLADLSARIAFCTGACGETVEFFCEKA